MTISEATESLEPPTEERLLLVERQAEERTALLRLNRPKQLNALNAQVMDALCDALEELDRDESVRVMVVTGNERAFAAGALDAWVSPITMKKGRPAILLSALCDAGMAECRR